MSSSDRASSDAQSAKYDSDDEGELNVDFKALFFGEALVDVGDDGGLDLIRQEVHMENLFVDRENNVAPKKSVV